MSTTTNAGDTAASTAANTFGATTTAAEVINGVDLTGRRAIVTGGASGIGVETARALVMAGAEVTIAVRNLAAGDQTVLDIRTSHPGAKVAAAPLDLADQRSVAAFVSAWGGPLHILVNNAGLMASPSCGHRRAGSCSSPPTTSATSRWRSGCTKPSPRRAARDS